MLGYSFACCLRVYSCCMLFTFVWAGGLCVFPGLGFVVYICLLFGYLCCFNLLLIVLLFTWYDLVWCYICLNY